MSFDLIKDKNKKVHFIGIGGISMSGLAKILLENGFKVSGSDRNESNIIKDLENSGADIMIGHNEKNLKNVDLVVYTAAIPKDNPEILKARELKIPMMDRAEFLGYIMKGHKFNVSISGTHGKTTTTSMFSHIALSANLDPTILVGGNLDAINGNIRIGNSEYFITEACEYKASFLKFFPYIGTILNIDEDHLDYYRDINHIQDTFLKFAKLIPDNGYLIANYDDARVVEICSNLNCNIISFGINNGSIQARNIQYNNFGLPSFDIYNDSDKLSSITLNVPGLHNIYNALASICTAIALDIPNEFIKKGLESFRGTHRRFEIKGTKNDITIIDDYAHHPTAIRSTLQAIENYSYNKLYCIFQPHTYSRTIGLFDEFVTSLSLPEIDELILCDIYAAREKDPGTINSQMLSDEINKKGAFSTNIHLFEEIVKYLKPKLQPNDIVMTIGAGDVFKVGELLLENL